MRKKNVQILSLEKDDPKKELEFEIAFNLSLTEKQRYKILIRLLRQTIKYVKSHDYPKTPAIISRS
jgi:hypothetical protein